MRLALTVVLCATAALAACSKAQAPPSADTPAAATPAALSDADRQKLVAALPTPYNAADLVNGEAKFALCRSCHTSAAGGANMTGPNLHGIFGRKTASAVDFKYSDALKGANFTWDAAHLDEWLAKPQDFLPGTKMTFPGLKDAKDRTDLIAYLMIETAAKP